MARRVFLSYRRADTAHQAIALKIVLEKKLPDISVFVDTASISPGEQWPSRLASAMDDSSAVVVLIGPHWRFGPDGADRFQDPDDWVLREVAHALDNQREVLLPVVFDTGDVALADLPRPVADLATIQARPLTPGERWVQDVDGIASDLSRMLGTTKVGGSVTFPTPSELKTRTPKVSEKEFEQHKLALASLSGWVYSTVPIAAENGEVQGTEISTSFTFSNFRRAFIFMARVAEIADARPHHPDWTNVWSRVDVRLRTFDAGHSVTWYDIEMASTMHRIFTDVTASKTMPWPLQERT